MRSIWRWIFFKTDIFGRESYGKPLFKISRNKKSFFLYEYVLIQIGLVNFFLERPNSIIAKIYRENCIRTKLNDFIYKNYPDRSILVFWWDSATSHCARTALDVLTSINIQFVKRAKTHQISPSVIQNPTFAQS